MDPNPELNQDWWSTAKRTAGDQPGFVTAMQLLTNGIVNTRNQISGNITHLTRRLEDLNSKLDQFNKSSEELTRRALWLTGWIMGATIISALATAILAADVILKWVK